MHGLLELAGAPAQAIFVIAMCAKGDRRGVRRVRPAAAVAAGVERHAPVGPNCSQAVAPCGTLAAVSP
jgi:hypothetical protein